MSIDDERDSDSPLLGEILGLEEPRERKPGLLTYQQREGLYDPDTVPEEQRAKFRFRLRQRVLNGLMDYDYMRALEPRDRRQLFEDLDDDEQLQNGITQALRFLYVGVEKDAGMDFETLLSDAVFNAETEQLGPETRSTVTDVEVDIDVQKARLANPQRARKKLERGEALAADELGVLLREAPENEAHELLDEARETKYGDVLEED